MLYRRVYIEKLIEATLYLHILLTYFTFVHRIYIHFHAEDIEIRLQESERLAGLANSRHRVCGLYVH